MTTDLFTTQVSEHLPALRRKAWNMTRDHHDAEDLYQSTLLRAFRRFETFEQGTNLGAWLHTIMKHLYINDYRKRKRRPVLVSGESMSYDEGGEVGPMEWQPTDENAHSVEDTIIGDELAGRLIHVINDLPETFRDTYVMFEHDGYSYREIAARQDIAIGTVMSRLSRARKLVRQAMSDQLVSA